MEAMEIVQILGFFGPLPTRLLKSRLSQEASSGLPAPLTCIVLTEDKLVPPAAQRRTAERLNSEETLEIDACPHGGMAETGGTSRCPAALCVSLGASAMGDMKTGRDCSGPFPCVVGCSSLGWLPYHPGRR